VTVAFELTIDARGQGMRDLDDQFTALLLLPQYTAASAALRGYAVVIPCDAISALEPFDLEASLRQTAFVFAGRLTTADGVRML
jgi:hypothetical protein